MSIIIRLQRLPLSANASDIRKFFFGLRIPEGSVHIVGGPEGDAFIGFATDEDARQAMRMDGRLINDNHIKLLLSSRVEMDVVIAKARAGVGSEVTMKGNNTMSSSSHDKRSPSPKRICTSFPSPDKGYRKQMDTTLLPPPSLQDPIASKMQDFDYFAHSKAESTPNNDSWASSQSRLNVANESWKTVTNVSDPLPSSSGIQAYSSSNSTSSWNNNQRQTSMLDIGRPLTSSTIVHPPTNDFRSLSSSVAVPTAVLDHHHRQQPPFIDSMNYNSNQFDHHTMQHQKSAIELEVNDTFSVSKHSIVI